MAATALAGTVTGEVRPGAMLERPEDLRAYVSMASIPLYHPVGTARMGRTDDPLAVVTPDLAVRGLSGLWVADASVFPSLPAGNTNATAIMVGDKGADHILRSLR
jgi:choline dehydrogenase